MRRERNLSKRKSSKLGKTVIKPLYYDARIRSFKMQNLKSCSGQEKTGQFYSHLFTYFNQDSLIN